MPTQTEAIPLSNSAGTATSSSAGIASSSSAGISFSSSDEITSVLQEENNHHIPISSMDQQPIIQEVNNQISKPTSSLDQQHKAKSSRMGFRINPVKLKSSLLPFKGRRRSKSEPKLAFVDQTSVETKHLESEHKGGGNKTTSHDSTHSLLRLVSRDLEYIEQTSHQLKDYDVLVDEKLKNAINKLETIKNALNDETPESLPNNDINDIQKELRQFKKHIRKLKLPIPPKFKINSADLRAHWDLHFNGSTQSAQNYVKTRLMSGIPKLHKNTMFERSSAFKDFQARYEALDIKLKLCLLCFSVFPEGNTIKKRLIIYWWIGEGFISPPTSERNNTGNLEQPKDLEQLGAEYFDELIRKDFIEPVKNKRSQEADSCKMHPFVRSAVITLAERAKFFDFDTNGKPTAVCPSSFRACLVGSGLDNDQDFEKIHMLFNVDETILEFKPEWFPKMKNVNILCLGRWQASANHHIEVEDTKFLEGLRHMKHLKYLSLQGISRITELPNSVSKLGNLTILDVRACHNLEVIPRDIGLLKSLTHLDLSECYLLDHMPKGLSLLTNLLVLKGFVVVGSKDRTSCTLEDLVKLPKLRKLSIFTGLKEFPEHKDLIAFPQFGVLCKLKVVWGGGAKQAKTAEKSLAPEKKGDSSEGDAASAVAKENHAVASRDINTPTPANGGDNQKKANKSKKPPPPTGTPSKLLASLSIVRGTPAPKITGLPVQLVKLDLQCFPGKSAPDWLKPSNLRSLKKLYIRGGQLHDLSGDHEWEDKGSREEPWNVETLRLKYLSGLGMNWRELRKLFPELIYLEKVKCPKLTLFPCDEAGVWLDKTKIQSSHKK